MRNKLPDRRLCITRKVIWAFEGGEHSVYINFGRDPHTLRIMEVFYADGQRSGTQLLHTVQDACVILSLLLQHGASPVSISKSLGTIELYQGTVPASIVGAIVQALEEEHACLEESLLSMTQEHPPNPKSDSPPENG